MADVTVRQLAETIGTPVDRLLQQMQEADLPQNAEEDPVSEDQKEHLLSHLKKSHGGESESAPRKITLKRRTLSTLKTGGSAGRGRTVNVEVRKKRTYVRRTPTEDDQPKILTDTPAPVPAPTVETPEPAVEPEVVDLEAKRRAAYAEVEIEAGKRRKEAADKAAELEKQKAEEAKEEERKQKAAALEAAKSKKEPEDAEGSKVSARKDKRDRHDLDEEDLKQWVGRQLADFKVPRVVHFIAQLPKTPLGKIQRQKLR